MGTTHDLFPRKRGDTIRAKWTMDGAATLGQAAKQLRELADELDELEAIGVQLVGPVEDDYGHIDGPGIEHDW